MKLDAMKLANALADARFAAEKAAEANSEDGGTCNFDTCTMPVERHKAVIARCAECAGVSVSFSKWFGKQTAFFSFGRGQANLNTRMEEAACRTLKAAGFDAHMYYQCD